MNLRPATLVRSLSRAVGTASPLYIDLGSSVLRLRTADSQVLEVPTCIALHEQTRDVVALGHKALSLVGKAPRTLQVVFPVQYGRVAHPLGLKLLLSALLKQLQQPVAISQLLLGREGSIAVCEGLSPVERDQLKTALQEAGLGRCTLVSQAQLVARSLVKKPSLTESYFFMDIGGQTTQLSLFSAGELLMSQTVRWGGVQFTEAVQELVRAEHACAIGWHEAEKLKLAIGLIDQPADAKPAKSAQLRKSTVRGKDVVTQLSKTVVVSSTLLSSRFEQLVNELLDTLESFFFSAPSEVTTSALEQGLFLTGGGAQLEGLAVALSHHLHCAVHLSANPTHDVIRGF